VLPASTVSTVPVKGFDPSATENAIWFNDPQRQGYVRIDEALFQRIQTERMRL
jgi:hypothetical protein